MTTAPVERADVAVIGAGSWGTALAILLFLSVLPVMILNIRRMQKEAA